MWNVRLITSICCSRVSRTKFTAYPDTRMVELRVFLRMLHRVQQRLAVQHVDVHVEAGRAEVTRRACRQVRDALLCDSPSACRHQR